MIKVGRDVFPNGAAGSIGFLFSSINSAAFKDSASLR